MIQVGQIQILRRRVYPQDPLRPNGPEVIVKPGRYPLFRDSSATFWVMRGRLNAGGVQDLGGGMFSVRPGDWPSEVEVECSSKRFGPEAWADLLPSPAFTAGAAAQRLRVLLCQECPRCKRSLTPEGGLWPAHRMTARRSPMCPMSGEAAA